MAGNWSRIECEATVQDYFAMWVAECRQQPYSKAEHRRLLKKKLRNRSDGSIEYKHQNISAILIRAGRSYIPGYKPAWNFQALLEKVVADWLNSSKTEVEKCEDMLIARVPINASDWRLESIFVPPPDRFPERRVLEKRKFVPKIVNFAEREARNRLIGKRGEELVLGLERQRLAALGREDLAADVEWTSTEKGDGAGYDIRSFFGPTDQALFIEVKSTNSGKYQPFLISANEVAFSEEHADQYSLYRVFDFVRTPAVFRLNGFVSQHVDLAPTLFRASY